ncbi:FecR family protein [Methanococcoides sp. LMO-2]|uniref:FecR family protein n=1 Tax=Methanococcoides cohabitans TaxID=3136559 RepID=A0ABU9KV23_9EURY
MTSASNPLNPVLSYKQFLQTNIFSTILIFFIFICMIPTAIAADSPEALYGFELASETAYPLHDANGELIGEEVVFAYGEQSGYGYEIAMSNLFTEAQAGSYFQLRQAELIEGVESGFYGPDVMAAESGMQFDRIAYDAEINNIKFQLIVFKYQDFVISIVDHSNYGIASILEQHSKVYVDETYISAPKVSITEVVGIVESLEGRVEVLHPWSDQWQKINEKNGIHEGDQVRTLRGAKATLKFDDGRSRVRLEERSFIEISTQVEEETDENIRVIKLFFGGVWTRVQKLAGIYLFVTTPTAVTGVKGTEYAVFHDPDLSTDRIYVQDGIVEVTTVNEIIDLYEGEKITVQEGYAGSVLTLGDEEWDDLMEDFGGEYPEDDSAMESESYPFAESEESSNSVNGLTALACLAMIVIAAVAFRPKAK